MSHGEDPFTTVGNIRKRLLMWDVMEFLCRLRRGDFPVPILGPVLGRLGLGDGSASNIHGKGSVADRGCLALGLGGYKASFLRSCIRSR